MKNGVEMDEDFEYKRKYEEKRTAEEKVRSE